MIDKWTLLNIRSRPDRRLVGVWQAMMLGVPIEDINIWYAKAPEELGVSGSDPKEIYPFVEEDGFGDLIEYRFEGCPNNSATINRICHLWNTCRFLRHLVENNETHMFCHDAVFLRHPHYHILSWNWWWDIVEILRAQDGGFKILFCGHSLPDRNHQHEPIEIGNILLKGICSHDATARVYTPEGAEFLLNTIRTNPYKSMRDILISIENTPGMYSTSNDLISDGDPRWFGSTLRNIPAYDGIYSDLFPEFKKMYGGEK